MSVCVATEPNLTNGVPNVKRKKTKNAFFSCKRMKTHDLEGIAKRVRWLRGALTQAEFGVKCGISTTQVSRIEHARHVPQYGTIAVVARACGVSPQWLMYGDGGSTAAHPAHSAVAVPAVSTGGGAISNTAIATAPGATATTGAPAAAAPAVAAAGTAAQGAQPLAEIAARLQAAERRIAALEQSMLAVQSAVIRGGVGAGAHGAGALPGSTPSAGEGAGA